MEPIRKAVIPVAGLGTRLLPATLATPKPLLPILNLQGVVTPIVQILVEEALDAGIREIAFVVSPEQRDRFEQFFSSDVWKPIIDQADGENDFAEIRDRWQHFLNRITFLEQESPEGFGHAVHQAREWVGHDSFLLMLGDHIYKTTTGESCISQLLGSWEGATTYGLTRINVDQAHKRGCLAGEPVPDRPGLYSVTKILEKPSPETAMEKLRTSGISEDEVLCLFGCYIFQPDIFDILELDICSNRRYRGEIQLTEAMEKLRIVKPSFGYEIRGISLDIGNPSDYRAAFSFLSEID